MDSAGTLRHGNIDHGGQNRRIRIGIGLLFAILAASLLLVGGDFPRWTRALLFFPLFAMFAGSFQGLHQVCYMAALRGVRCVDGEELKVSDAAELKRMRRDVRLVMLESVAGAALAAGLLFLIP